MGSWDETCFVSKMTIRAGERVRILFLRSAQFKTEELETLDPGESDKPVIVTKGNNECYSTDFWSPLSYPIRAEYDDYGSFDVIEKTKEDKATVKLLLSAVKTGLVKLGVGENSCHDVSVDPETIDMEGIKEAVREGRLYHKTIGVGKYEYLPLGAVFIKETVWQELLKVDFSDWIWRKDSPRTIDDRFVKIKQMFDMWTKTESFSDWPANWFSRGTATFTGDSGMGREPLFSQRDVSVKDRKELLMLAAQMEHVHILLSGLRIHYSLTTGSGSQQRNIKVFENVYSAFAEIARLDEKEFDEECNS